MAVSKSTLEIMAVKVLLFLTQDDREVKGKEQTSRD